MFQRFKFVYFLFIATIFLVTPQETFSIPIDDFNSAQTVISSTLDKSEINAVNNQGSIGGKRRITAKLKSGTSLTTSVASSGYSADGIYNFQLLPDSSGEAKIIWDGASSLTENVSETGFPLRDLAPKGETMLRLYIHNFTYANFKPTELNIKLFGPYVSGRTGADESSRKVSSYKLILNNRPRDNELLNIAFSNFKPLYNAVVDIHKVNAISIQILGDGNRLILGCLETTDGILTSCKYKLPEGKKCLPGQMPGDANGDCCTNLEDREILKSNFGKPSQGAINGDFNDDGFLDAADFAAWSDYSYKACLPQSLTAIPANSAPTPTLAPTQLPALSLPQITNKLFDANGAGALTNFVDGNGTGIDRIVNEAGNNVYAEKGPRTLFGSEYIKVHPNYTYRLKGKFKSTGTNLSKLFFGLAHYDINGKLIFPWYVLRRGSDAKILTVANNVINVTTQGLNDWAQPGTVAYDRSLGFYYDGNTDKLPDFVLTYYPDNNSSSTATTSGSYNSLGTSTINLNTALPAAEAAKIIANVSVVKNHYSGSTYQYSAASNVSVPKSWTNYESSNITGEGFSVASEIFRKSTRFVRILILSNYGQTENEELYFDDIKFEQIGGAILYPGDYDGNGCVDDADRIFWKNAARDVSVPKGTGADGNGDGYVDLADYTTWRDNLGKGVCINPPTPTYTPTPSVTPTTDPILPGETGDLEHQIIGSEFDDYRGTAKIRAILKFPSSQSNPTQSDLEAAMKTAILNYVENISAEDTSAASISWKKIGKTLKDTTAANSNSDSIGKIKCGENCPNCANGNEHCCETDINDETQEDTPTPTPTPTPTQTYTKTNTRTPSNTPTSGPPQPTRRPTSTPTNNSNCTPTTKRGLGLGAGYTNPCYVPTTGNTDCPPGT